MYTFKYSLGLDLKMVSNYFGVRCVTPHTQCSV